MNRRLRRFLALTVSCILSAVFFLFSFTIANSVRLSEADAGQTAAPKKTSGVPQGRKATFIVTAYTAHDKGMNGRGITASGVKARAWHTVAASRAYPFGTKIYFAALGRTVVVEDRGGAIRGNKIDLFVGHNDKQQAKKFGRRKLVGVILR